MNFLGTLFSGATSAVSGFSIGTWIKIGLVVVVALAIGGLYEYGQHEASLVTAANKQIGADAQIIADDKANIDALQKANQNWANAFKKYQADAARQQADYQKALKVKDDLNAELSRVRKLLSNGPAASAALDDLDHRLVCLLDSASGGAGHGCPGAAPGASGAAASGAP